LAISISIWHNGVALFTLKLKDLLAKIHH